MGAVSPVPFADAAFMQKVEERVIKPTIQGLQTEDVTYTGFIFIGLMNVKGDPYVIEYNVRMGDPETEVVIPRIKTDFVELLQATAQGTLNEVNLEIDQNPAATIMLVSGGYPESYEKGKAISGLNKVEDVVAFHAATRQLADGQVVTDGGRVMALTATGTSLDEALQKASKAAEHIVWENKYYRKDIGLDVLYLNINS
jgi:phosphoribosylamine--glycine ligase